MRLPPELLTFVREQRLVRGLIEAEQSRLQAESQALAEDHPEAAEPIFATGRQWVVCRAPARERQRLGREFTQVRFPELAEEQFPEPSWALRGPSARAGLARAC